MKRLIMIGGTMGVGKTVTSKVLQKKLNNSVFLDGDWCWNMYPFIVNEETKAMVMDNITHMLNNFIQCDTIENIIFCWVMHQQGIIDDLLSKLDTENCEVYTISLICSPKILTEHIQHDVDQGMRTPDVLKRSLERLDMYKKMNTYLIDVSSKTIEETANVIYDYVCEGDRV